MKKSLSTRPKGGISQSIYQSGGISGSKTSRIPRSEIENKENARKYDEIIKRAKNQQ